MGRADRLKKEARTTPNGEATAPEIVLPVGPAESWAARDFRGKPVVLVFYPADWEPVSTDQLRHYNEIVPQVRAFDAELVGISVDSVWCHQAFARALELRFRLLSDACPRGCAARAYGVYRSRQATSERALFVIDTRGVIRRRYVAPPEIHPGVDGVFDGLGSLGRTNGAGVTDPSRAHFAQP